MPAVRDSLFAGAACGAGLYEGKGELDGLTDRQVDVMPCFDFSQPGPRANAAIYGYTATDARNDAYRNAARYFCKRDAMRYAERDEVGAWHLAPQVSGMHVGTIEIKPYVRPVVAPRPVIVIPKDMLDRKIQPEPQKVASAQ